MMNIVYVIFRVIITNIGVSALLAVSAMMMLFFFAQILLMLGII